MPRRARSSEVRSDSSGTPPGSSSGGRPAARSLASSEFAPVWKTSTIVEPKQVM